MGQEHAHRTTISTGTVDFGYVLTAQNTYVNTLMLLEIARFGEVFANYRIVASMGNLLPTLGLPTPPAAAAYARAQARVASTPPAETMRRYSPDRGSGFGISGIWQTEVKSGAWETEVRK